MWHCVIKPMFSILPYILVGLVEYSPDTCFPCVEAAEWHNRCVCIDCREQTTHSMAGRLPGDAGAARESCDINGTSQT